jgi:hypothetical protein
MMSTRWQCWAKRSTMATTQATPGETVPHCPELRRRIVELVRAGRSPESLAKEFEPSAPAIQTWGGRPAWMPARAPTA